MELLMTESHMYLLDIKFRLSLTGQHNNREIIFHQVEFVNKNNLEAQNLYSDCWCRFDIRWREILVIIEALSRQGLEKVSL